LVFSRNQKLGEGKDSKASKKNDVVKLILLCSLLTKKGNWINKNFMTLNEIEKFLVVCLNLIKNRKKKELLKFLKTKLDMEIKVNLF
jgi:hypothetical protein